MVYRTFEENKYTGRKGRGRGKPVAAGDEENNIVRRVEEGSRTAVQQLGQRMQSLNKTSGLGGPSMPQTVGMLFSLILSICDFAAAEPWAQASQQACLEGTAYFTREQIAFSLLLGGGGNQTKKPNRADGNVCIPLDKGCVRMEGGGQGSGYPHLRWVSKASSWCCLEIQHFWRQLAKPSGRPLPQQISVNQSSCRRSGRRRSGISLEPGGPPARARSQLHSCSVFWYLAPSRLHNCTMRSPSLLLHPLWEQEVGKRKITKKKPQTGALQQPPGTGTHSGFCGEQQTSSFNSRDAMPFSSYKKMLVPRDTNRGCFPNNHPWNDAAFHSMISSIHGLCIHCNLTFCTCLRSNQRKGSLMLCCFWEVQVRSKPSLSLLGQRCQPTLPLWEMGRIFCSSHRYFEYLMQDSYVRPWM